MPVCRRELNSSLGEINANASGGERECLLAFAWKVPGAYVGLKVAALAEGPTTNVWFDSLENTWEAVRKTVRSWGPKKIKQLELWRLWF